MTTSLRPLRPAAIERAVGARLQVGKNVVDVGRDVRIVGEPLHLSAAGAVADDAPESVEIGQPLDQRGAERRAEAVLAVAVVAASVKAAIAVVGLGIDLAVDDAIELATGRAVLRGRAARNREAAAARKSTQAAAGIA